MTTKKSPVIRVDRAVHTRTLKSRIDFAALLGVLAPESDFYNAHPEIQSAAATVQKAAADLADSDTAATAADAVAAVARGVRDAKKAAFDQCFGVLSANVEMHATSIEDVKSVAYDPHQRSARPLVSPLSVAAEFDPKKELILIEVTRAPGLVACIIEISTDPVGAATWKRIPGVGASRSVSGYPPGTYWVRAASAKGGAESAWTTPVAVFVK